MKRSLGAAVVLLVAGGSRAANVKRSSACAFGRMLPTVFITGAQKCGTTSLNADMKKVMPGLTSAVKTLPSLGSSLKELHYFDSPGMYERGIGVYARCYPPCPGRKATEMVAIDSTPRYLRFPAVAERIRNSYAPHLRPQLRFIMILRDPAERLRSWYDHFGTKKERAIGSRTGLEPNEVLNKWVRMALSAQEECARVHSVDVTSGALWKSKCRTLGKFEDALSAGLYAPQLQNFLDHFKARQAAVISFGGYVKRPRHVLVQLGSFLGLTLDIKRRQLLGEGEAHEFASANRTSELAVGRRALLEASHSNARAKRTLSPGTRARLDAFYRPHIRELGELLLLRAQALGGYLRVLPTDIVPRRADRATPFMVGKALLAEP